MDTQNTSGTFSEKTRKTDLFLVAILLLGIAVFAAVAYLKLPAAGGTSGYYVDSAENLLKGKGFVFDFIDEYYIKFPSVTHPDEWGLPGMAIITAPFIYFLGKTPFAINLPNMIIGLILFPVLIYYLGKEFFDKKIGFLAAVSTLFFSPTFNLSFTGQRDVIYAFFLLLGIFYFYKAIKDDSSKYFYLMGLFLGMSYLIRQTTLIVFPALILAYYLIQKRIDLKLIKGMLVAVLVMSPFLIRNYLLFGNPLFTANKYALWIYGWFNDYDPLGYMVYWDSPKPSLSWLLSLNFQEGSKYSFIMSKIIRQATVQFYSILILNITAFIGLFLTRKEETKLVLKTAIALILAFSVFAYIATAYLGENVYFGYILFIAYSTMLLMANFIFAKEGPANRIFALLWIFFIGFHAVLGYSETRFFVPLIPLFFMYSWSGIYKILERISAKYTKFEPKYFWKALLIILIIVIAISTAMIQINLPKDAQHEKEKITQLTQMGELLKAKTPDSAVIMACNAVGLHQASDRKIVEMPRDDIPKIIEVMKWYQVSHMAFSGCSVVNPNLFYAIFNQTTPPADYDRILYKVNLTEGREGEYKVVNLNPVEVGRID